MSINCDVFADRSATPDQLRALGTALWRWHIRAAGNSSIYQYLDNQALADLIAGRSPAPGQMSWQAEKGYFFRIQDQVSHDRPAAIDRLRHEMPAQGIEDILVDGASWNLTDQYTIPRRMNYGKATSNTNPNDAKQTCESQTQTLSRL